MGRNTDPELTFEPDKIQEGQLYEFFTPAYQVHTVGVLLDRREGKVLMGYKLGLGNGEEYIEEEVSTDKLDQRVVRV